jgi:hypothetical protein
MNGGPYTIVITNNKFKYDTSGSKMYFTITKWTAVENTDDSTKADYPNGYKLEGSVTETSGNWIFDDWNTVGNTTSIYVFMHKDGSKMG